MLEAYCFPIVTWRVDGGTSCDASCRVYEDGEVDTATCRTEGIQVDDRA